VLSAQTFDKILQQVCASGLDVTHSHVPLQHHHTLPFIHPSPQSPPLPLTQQQLAQLQLQIVQSQQREQLQWQLVYREQLLQQFMQQQLHRQQQQQFFTSHNAPPSQESLLMNHGSLVSTQPWTSEVLQVETPPLPHTFIMALPTA
jgi:hypothetical protein